MAKRMCCQNRKPTKEQNRKLTRKHTSKITAAKAASGVTLVELLVVVALLGIILSVAVPRFYDFVPRIQLESAARGLSAEFRLAQQKAITTGKRCTIRFYLYGHRYRTFYPGSSESIDLPTGISYATINFPSDDGAYGIRRLYFNRSGAPNRGGTVGLKNEYGDRIYVIVTPATGRVRISDIPPD